MEKKSILPNNKHIDHTCVLPKHKTRSLQQLHHTYGNMLNTLVYVTNSIYFTNPKRKCLIKATNKEYEAIL